MVLSPDKIAIWFDGNSITYRELFDKIDNVANHLYAFGVREGTVVTIHISNCPEAIISIYAVAKLGGICNMVHPLIPKETLNPYLSFTESKYLITGSDGVFDAVKVIHLNDFADYYSPALCSAICPAAVELAEKSAVYVMSSGTTSVPKTAVFTHKAINAYQNNMLMHFDYPPKDIVALTVAPYCHLLGFSGEVHRPISTGGQMVIMRRWDSSEAMELISRYHVTLLSGVPKLYNDLLSEPGFSGERVAPLQYCYIGGDTVSQQMLDEIDKRVGHCVSFPIYGMTELGCHVCAMTRVFYKSGATGYPIDGVKALVINNDGGLAEVGEGELLIASEHMMTGYLKNTEANREIFFDYDGTRWIRTGDYGRIDSDGYIYFICRIKNLIIHNGYNVIPAEIENVIRKVPNVKDVLVFGKMNAKGTEDIFAAVILEKVDRANETQELIDAEYRKELPRYEWPKRLLFLSDFPRNSFDMKKIDIDRLRETV